MSVIVVGYDTWTEAVLDRLRELAISYTVLVTDPATEHALVDRGHSVVQAPVIDETAFRTAGVTSTTAVLVATLDDQENVLTVLTAADLDPEISIITFVNERVDAPKLRRAGADVVVNIGAVIAALLVQTALSEADPDHLLAQLLTEDTTVETASDVRAVSTEDDGQ